MVYCKHCDEHNLLRAPHKDGASAWCLCCTMGGVNSDNTTRGRPPSRDGLEDHQVWVWLAGAPIPHYEIRGTGLVIDPDWIDLLKRRKPE